MNRVTFNTGAVLLVLLALPLAVGAITNTAAQDEDRDWTPSYAPDNSGASTYAFWVNNGEDFSQHYEANVGSLYANCSYIAPPDVDYPSLLGQCSGTSFYSVPFDLIGETVSNIEIGIPAIQMPVSENHIPAGDYLGTSGAGPFSWTFTPNVNQYENGTLPESFRWTFIQPAATYACTGTHFVDLKYDLEASWLNYDPSATPPVEEIFTVNVDNIESTNRLQVEAFIGGHWTTACFIGMQVQVDLTGYEQIALNTRAREFGWGSVYMQLTLDDFELADSSSNANIGQTELPWNGDAGDGEFLIALEYSTRNEAEVNFFIRGGTLVLSIAVMAVGIASTPYWDPLQNWFRGRI